MDVRDLHTQLVEAHRLIQDHIHQTPILTSTYLNTLSGAQLFFKCENFQKIGAFKMRGALHAVLTTSEEERSNGFVTHSSGNHGQAVARAAQLAGVKAYIVMPKGAPTIKIEAVKAYGGIVTLCDNSEQARIETCQKIIAQTQANFVHPYDNTAVILGQSTCAKEIYDHHPDLDYLLCPVGGGGLASGSILATQAFSPTTKVVLCEPQNADDAYRSFTQKKHQKVVQPNTVADGLKTSLGERNFKIILDGAHAIFTVSEEEIIEAMRLIWERLKIICESSCSLPLAVVLKYPQLFKNQKIALILTGGNVDLDNLPF